MRCGPVCVQLGGVDRPGGGYRGAQAAPRGASVGRLDAADGGLRVGERRFCARDVRCRIDRRAAGPDGAGELVRTRLGARLPGGVGRKPGLGVGLCGRKLERV